MALQYNVDGKVRRYYDKSAANTQLVLTIPANSTKHKILNVAVAYKNGAADQTVTTTTTIRLDSDIHADYDYQVGSIALSAAAWGSWSPTGEMWITKNDQLIITVPAGGVGFTSTVIVTALVE